MKEVSFLLRSFRNHVIGRDVGSARTVKVLDVGCATGRVIRKLARGAPMAYFVGVDISSGMIRRAAGQDREKTDYVIADIRRLPFPSDAFDFVYCLEVIEHLSEKRTSIPLAIAEIVRVTRELGHSTVESTSQYHFKLQGLLKRMLPRLRASEPALTAFAWIYSKAPLLLAEPSSIGFVEKALASSGATVRSVSWIRVLPEQTFIFIRGTRLRKVLMIADEILSRLPAIKYLGREFLIFSQKQTEKTLRYAARKS